jgi:hypothetical protein
MSPAVTAAAQVVMSSSSSSMLWGNSILCCEFLQVTAFPLWYLQVSCSLVGVWMGRILLLLALANCIFLLPGSTLFCASSGSAGVWRFGGWLDGARDDTALFAPAACWVLLKPFLYISCL